MRVSITSQVCGLVLTVGFGALASADNLVLHKANPDKFVFTRGGEPVELTVTADVDVTRPGGDDVALGVHDERGRPLMTSTQPFQHVGQGHSSLVFKPSVQVLAPDVREVIVDAVLMKSVKSGTPSKFGDRNTATLRYKVK